MESTNKPEMDEIVIGFSRPSGWFEPFSWLIRLVTWSAYSHTYIKYYNSYTDRWEVYQASGLKVNFIGQKLFDSEEIICSEFTIPIPQESKRKTIQFAVDNCGLPYAMKQVFGLLWVLLVKLFGKNISNPWASGSSYFCSELVSTILNDLGEGTLDASVMAPTDVYNFLISKGFKPSASS